MDKTDIRDLILKELKQNSVDENSSYNNKIIDNTDFEFIAENIVEKLPIYVVSQQRELLIDFMNKTQGELIWGWDIGGGEKLADEYLKGNL